MKTAIVSGANAPFFGMLVDLLDSIDAVRIGEPLDFCVLDVGLTSEQRTQLEARTKKIVEPGWDFNFPLRDRMPRHMQAQLARPFLPKHFPGYDRYLYLDADLWLQDYRAIQLLLLASHAENIAIIPEIHRAYSHNYRIHAGQLSDLAKHYVRGWGEQMGVSMANMPIINSGVWAMRYDLPYWDAWADTLHFALQRDANHMSEQCALNVALYSGKIAYYALPAWCNWITSMAAPILDTETGTFHEPLLPHEELSIVHLVGNKTKPIDIQCVDGKVRKMPLTYSSVRRSIRPGPSAL